MVEKIKEIAKVEQPTTEQQKAEEFLKEYQELCSASGYQIVVSPAYRATAHGSWETVLQTSVGLLPKG